MIAPLLAAAPTVPSALSTLPGGQAGSLLSSDFLDCLIASYNTGSLPNCPAPTVSPAPSLSETLPAASPTGTEVSQAAGTLGRSDVLSGLMPAGIAVPSKSASLTAVVEQRQVPAAPANPADGTQPAPASDASRSSHPAPDTMGELPPPSQPAPAGDTILLANSPDLPDGASTGAATHPRTSKASPSGTAGAVNERTMSNSPAASIPKESPATTATPPQASDATNSPGSILPTASPGTTAPPGALDTSQRPTSIPAQDELSPAPRQMSREASDADTLSVRSPQGSATRRGASRGAHPLTRLATAGTSKSILPGNPSSADQAALVAPQLPSLSEIAPAPKATPPAASLTGSETRDEAAAVDKPGANVPPAQQVAPSAEALTAPSDPLRSLAPSSDNAAASDPVHPAAAGQLPSGVQPVLPSPAMPSATPLLAHPAQDPVVVPQPNPGDSAPSNAAALQVAPALVHIAAATGGASHVTVKLTPIELGEVRIHIERPSDGPVQVTVEATRPETLRLLRQDEPALHRVLDQAGLPSDGRTVVLQQTPDGPSPDAGGARRDTTSSDQSSTSNGQGGRDSSQGWQQPGDTEATPDLSPPQRSYWTRAGINITA
jgi:flagellar hook-length control protein FliK